MRTRWLICGGRDYDDWQVVCETLDRILKNNGREPSLIIEGGARGADKLGRQWALCRGLDCLTVPARWSVHGKAAGWIRNERMIEYNPDLVVAFPGGRGTANMVGIAKKHDVEVIEVL